MATGTNEIIRRNIREFREGSGKTKSELAASIKLSRRFWDDVENGTKEPSVSTVERMAEALGVTFQDLTTDRRKSPRRERELQRSR